MNGGVRALQAYYTATAGFVLADWLLGLNLRVSFLDAEPAWRAAWYLLCLACLAAMLWRPAWAPLLTLVESAATLVALILTTGLRVLVVTDAMIETGRGVVTPAELVNFAIAGGAGWFALHSRMQALRR